MRVERSPAIINDMHEIHEYAPYASQVNRCATLLIDILSQTSY